ncbi:hypothetical protein [Ensifer sp. Root31]|uniref:hypothetical protein n=1 Tax=Ensifer sp. Root31 TaxID=1736512 RepID=UPI001FCD66E8|nr:hypothetical protein [Ensifer sp. Root31]
MTNATDKLIHAAMHARATFGRLILGAVGALFDPAQCVLQGARSCRQFAKLAMDRRCCFCGCHLLPFPVPYTFRIRPDAASAKADPFERAGRTLPEAEKCSPARNVLKKRASSKKMKRPAFRNMMECHQNH